MPSILTTQDLINNSIDQRTACGTFDERYVLEDSFDKIVRPVGELEATLGTAAAVRTYTAANKNLLLTGTNPVSTFAVAGGNRIGTGATLNDRAIVAPGQLGGPTAFSSWNETQWSTDRAPRLDVEFNISSLAAVSILMGLAQSVPNGAGTEEDVASLGNNAIVLAFNDASTINPTGFRPVTVAGGVKVDSPGTGGTIGASQIPVLAAGTTYRVQIGLNASRVPYYTINAGGSMVAQFTASPPGALAAATNLIPFVYIRTRGAAARFIDLRFLRLSQRA